MPKINISRAAVLEGRELLKRLRMRFPVLFPADRKDLKPWAVGEDIRMRQALADAEDGETVSTEVWRAAIGRWFHGDLKRRVAYLKGLTEGAPRYDIHGNESGAVSEGEATYAAMKLAQGQAQLARLRAGAKATKEPETATATEVSGNAGQGKENGMIEGEPLADRIWRQVEHGVDVDLLPTREKRAKDLAKKLDRELDHNGWRMFVSGCVYTMTSGKGPQRRNAEVMLVETVRRWRDQVVDLLPERALDLRRIVEAGLDRPEPPPRKEG